MNKPQYLSLKTAKASKIGQRSQGDIHYHILTDPSHQQLYLFITGNDEDGYYSKEVVPFEKVEQCLQGIKPNSPLSSQLFKPAFIGQSNNNAAFLAAILRNEKLIQPVVDAVRKHSLQPGWDSWKAALLKNAAKAKPFEPEVAKPRQAPVTESDNAELDDDEMELLQRSSTKRPESRP
ncbi:MAG: hypothetical protein ACXV8Q_04825 [Methylobacter sp.]